MKKKDNSLSKSSLILNLLYSMVPLLVFWIIEENYGLEKGIIAAVFFAMLEVAWVYYKERRFEPFAVWSAVLIIVMGLVSWKLHNKAIIMLKPAIMEGIFASILLFSSLVKKPFMLIIAKKQMGEDINPIQLKYLSGVNFRIGLLFLLHTGLTVYAAIWNQAAWGFVKFALFYILFIVYFIFEFIYSRYNMRKQMERIQKEYEFLEYQKEIIRQVRQPVRHRAEIKDEDDD